MGSRDGSIPDGIGKRTLDLDLPQSEPQIHYLPSVQFGVDQFIFPSSRL